MRFPTKIIWDIIGDAFTHIIKDDDQRIYDILWQTKSALSGQAMGYVDEYKRSKNIFEISEYAPWGTYSTIPKLVAESEQAEGLIIGKQGSNWLALTDKEEEVPGSGWFSILGDSARYTSSSNEDLQSDYSVAIMRAEKDETWDPEENPSDAFGSSTTLDGSDRWKSVGSWAMTPQNDGLLMDPKDSNWAVVQDKFWFSGSQDWSVLLRLRVEDWSDSDFLRAFAINCIGDHGPDYEFRLSDNGSSVAVTSGVFAKTRYSTLTFSGNDISRTKGSFRTDGFMTGMSVVVTGTDSNDGIKTITAVTPNVITVSESLTAETSPTATITNQLDSTDGDTSGFRDKLLSAGSSDPLYIEVLTRYTASSAQIFSKLWLDGALVQQESAYDVSPGRKNISFDVFNQAGNMDVVLEFVAAIEGELDEATEGYDFTTKIGDSFGYIYETEEPIIDCRKIRWDPYDLAADVEVLFHNSNQIKVELNEDFNSYAPDVCRIESGDEHLVGVLASSEVNPSATYDIDYSSAPGTIFDGQVVLKPFETEEFQWLETSQFAVPRPLPVDGKRFFFTESEADEVMLYERFGRLLEMPERPDSPEYLAALRGMKYGLETPPTSVHTARALAIVAGLPFAKTSGFIERVERVTDGLGSALHDVVTISGRSVRIDPFWSNSGLLKQKGVFLEKFEPLVSNVSVWDWKSNLDLIQERVESIWNSWGTFVVQIPSTIGLSQTKANDVIRLLRRAKNKETTFLIEYKDEQSENVSREEVYENFETVQYGHNVEDIVFDDDGTVYQNAMDYQTIGGQDYSEEYQSNSLLYLDQNHFLDQNNHIDSDRLVLHDYKYRGDGKYYWQNSGINLKRDLSAEESSSSRVTLRMRDTDEHQPYRPYELCWLFTGASPQFSVRDGGGTFYTYHTQDWESRTTGTTDSLNAVYMADRTNGHVVGDNGTIYETTDYGQNWSDSSIATTDDFLAAHNNWVVGNNDAVYENDGGWNSVGVGGGGFTFTGVYFPTDDVGYIVGHDGTDSTIFKTTDGGTSWDAGTSIDTNTIVSGVHFVDNANGWVSSDVGLGRTSDGGVTWDFFDTGRSFNAVHMLDSSTVIGVGDAGVIRKTSDATVTTPTFVGSDGAVTAGNVSDVWFIDDEVGDIVALNGDIFRSRDAGENWTDVSTAGSWSATYGVPTWYRIVVGGTNSYRWK